MRFGIHRVPTSLLIYDFHQVLTVFTQPNVIPTQLYQGFWQFSVFFFTRRATSITFRLNFRINIGYDYFHISLFLIFKLILFLSKSFYFFILLLFPIANVSNKIIFWVIFFRNFSRSPSPPKRRITNFFSRVRVFFAEETRNVYEILSLFPVF